MSLTNPQDAVFASPIATDKIVAVYTGSFNSNTASTLGGYLPYTEFDHNFPRPVFLKAQFSKDQVSWTDMNSRNPWESSATCGIALSTASKIRIIVDGPQGVVYYRVLAFWIDDYDASNPLVPPTQGSLSKAYFDSRLNYQKIYLQDSFTASGVSGSTDIPHDLGYEPNVRVYCESLPGQIWPAVWGGLKNPWLYDFDMVECNVEIYNNRVHIDTWGGVSSPNVKVWYVIYYDA